MIKISTTNYIRDVEPPVVIHYIKEGDDLDYQDEFFLNAQNDIILQIRDFISNIAKIDTLNIDKKNRGLLGIGIEDNDERHLFVLKNTDDLIETILDKVKKYYE